MKIEIELSDEQLELLLYLNLCNGITATPEERISDIINKGIISFMKQKKQVINKKLIN